MIINSGSDFYLHITSTYKHLVAPTSMETLNLSEDDGMYIMKNTFENAEMLIILDFVMFTTK